MFPVFSTVLAIILCLVGLDVKDEYADPSINSWAWLPLLIIPLGEGLVLLARIKAAIFPRKTLRFLLIFFSAYPLLSYSTALFLLDWIYLPDLLGIGNSFFLDKAFLIAAYLGLSNLTRFYRMRFARSFHSTALIAGRMGLQIAFKGELTLMIPLATFVLFSDLIALDERVVALIHHLPLLFWASLLTLFLSLAYAMPGLIKALWRLKPLPLDSPVREKLFRFMNSQNFKVRDILTWQTGGHIFNAALLGLTPRSRYILFTDGMLQRCTLPELRAVLAHEMGHGKNRHLPIYFLFSTAFIFSVSILETFLKPLTLIESKPEILFALVGILVLSYWWLVFGLLSRRFEMEADIFGAEAVRDPRIFIHTLDKIARLGRMDRHRGSWRHFSVERRIESLGMIFFENPYIAVRFWRKMKWLRRLLILFSLSIFLVFSLVIAVDTVAGMGILAMKNGDCEKALVYLEKASELPFGGIHRWALLKALLRSNQLDGAHRLLGRLMDGVEPGQASEQGRVSLIELALALLRNGRYGQSSKIFDQALAYFPHDADLLTLKNLADLYMEGNTQPLLQWIQDRNGEKTSQNGSLAGFWKHLSRRLRGK